MNGNSHISSIREIDNNRRGKIQITATTSFINIQERHPLNQWTLQQRERRRKREPLRQKEEATEIEQLKQWEDMVLQSLVTLAEKQSSQVRLSMKNSKTDHLLKFFIC